VEDSNGGPKRKNHRLRISAPPRTKSAKDIRRAAKKGIIVKTAWVDDLRPSTRGECENEIRPCPWVMCKYHLYLDVGDTGSIKFNFPDLEPHEMRVSCSLDVANQGGATLNEIGDIMNLSRERIRQLEVKIVDKLRDRSDEIS
jgi:hypothetical protein